MIFKTLMERKYNPAWGSHIPVLLKGLELTTGPVLELGVGVFSTPVLNELCTLNKRQLISYEDELEFYTMHKSFENAYHKVIFVEDWDKIKIEDTMWDFAFIDHKAKRRKIEAKRLMNNAKYIALHDSEGAQNHHYNYREEVYPLFKYQYDFNKLRPHTTVVSNIINLDNFKI